MKTNRPTHGRTQALASAVVIFLSLAMHKTSQAQTTLSGDHVITGDLKVGTTGTTGNISVVGDLGSSAAPGIQVTGDGGVIFDGTAENGFFSHVYNPAPSRFSWFPKKGALKIGMVVDSLTWSGSSVGDFSFSTGTSEASGRFSTAVGLFSKASGTSSVAIAAGEASESYSIAIGPSVASGLFSVAMGGVGAVASGTLSIALGGIASGDGSIAIGGESTGLLSVAVGYSLAQGEYSASFNGSISAANYSSSFGETIAGSTHCMTVGKYNVFEGDPENWVPTDPLFVVGNGSGDSEDPPEIANRNAFAVYKNGNVIIPKRQGDILMGEFGDPE